MNIRYLIILFAATLLFSSSFYALGQDGGCEKSCTSSCKDLKGVLKKDCLKACFGGRCQNEGILQQIESTGQAGLNCSHDGVCNDFCPIGEDVDCFILPVTHFDDFEVDRLPGWSVTTRDSSYGVVSGELIFDGQLWAAWRPYGSFPTLPTEFKYQEIEWEIGLLIDESQRITLDSRSGGTLVTEPVSIVPLVNGHDFYIHVDGVIGAVYQQSLTTGYHTFTINWNRRTSLYSVYIDHQLAAAISATFRVTGPPDVNMYNSPGSLGFIDYFKYTIVE